MASCGTLEEKCVEIYEFVGSRWILGLCTDVRRHALKQKREFVNDDAASRQHRRCFVPQAVNTV